MEFVGLIVSILFMLVFFLPVWSLIRVSRVSRELEELRAQMAEIESQLRSMQRTAAAAPPPAPVQPSRVAPPIPDFARAETPTSFVEAAPIIPPIPIGADYATASAFARDEKAPSFGETPPADAQPEPSQSVDEAAPDLEARIGGRWLLYTGVLVVLLGVAFFLKYAFDNAWIDERGRVISGVLAGLGLIAAGTRFRAQELATFGQALMGTGLAMLYLAIYAALNFYELIDRTTAFALMVLVTIGAGVLADRTRSQAMAVIAVGGGFITPFLVGGGDDAQLTLFTYDALLVAGTLALAQRHHWFGLIALSYILTVVTLLGWAARHYSDEKWLRTLLFLTLFCVLFIQILRSLRDVAGAVATIVRGLLWTAPVFYHVFAVLLTGEHPPAFHVYIIIFTVVGLWFTAEPHRPAIRLLIVAAAYVPLFGDATLPDGLSWIVPNVVTIVAVSALHVLGILDRIYRQEQPLEPVDMLLLHVTGLGLFGLLYESLQPAYPHFRGGLAALIALGAAALAYLLHHRDRMASLNAAALAFTLLAVGVAVQFDGPVVIVGWAAEGAAIAWFGMRASNIAFQFGGLALWALAALRLLQSYRDDTPAAFTAIFNVRAISTLFVVVLAYLLAWLFQRSRETIADAGRIRAALHVAASFITIAWITVEIGSYWDVRSEMTQAYLYEQLVLSLAWGTYGAILIAFGMWRGYAPVRYIGITVLAITILKVFFFDLWELGGIYRVIGFLGFGVLLMLVSYLYQKKRQPTIE